MTAACLASINKVVFPWSSAKGCSQQRCTIHVVPNELMRVLPPTNRPNNCLSRLQLCAITASATPPLFGLCHSFTVGQMTYSCIPPTMCATILNADSIPPCMHKRLMRPTTTHSLKHQSSVAYKYIYFMFGIAILLEYMCCKDILVYYLHNIYVWGRQYGVQLYWLLAATRRLTECKHTIDLIDHTL
jgi:hypothetical protein